MKNLASKNDRLSSDHEKNQLHEKFLKWRIYSNPKNYLENMNSIRIGAHLLDKGCIKKAHNDFLNKLRGKAKCEKINNKLIKLCAKYDDKGKLELLRIKFKFWRICLGDKAKMQHKLQDFVNRFIISEPGHRGLIEAPVNDLIDGMKTWNKL